MLGYTYDDIQHFGQVLKWAEHYTPLSDTEARDGLLKIWDFFEGLLGEGYITENTFYGDDAPNEAMDYAEEMQLMGIDQ